MLLAAGLRPDLGRKMEVFARPLPPPALHCEILRTPLCICVTTNSCDSNRLKYKIQNIQTDLALGPTLIGAGRKISRGREKPLHPPPLLSAYYFCSIIFKIIFPLLLFHAYPHCPKIPKAFLIRSGAQRNIAHTLVLTLHTDLPPQIFHVFSN